MFALPVAASGRNGNELLPKHESVRVWSQKSKSATFGTSLLKKQPSDSLKIQREYFLVRENGYILGLRTNLLRWASLTPDIGLEWRINRNWSVGMDLSYSNWRLNHQYYNYGLFEVAPEVKYYLGRKLNWFAGVQLKAGAYDYKTSVIGHQGNFFGGGVTGGYRLFLKHSLALDFSLGLGYIYAANEDYQFINGVNVSKGKSDRHWGGPTSAGVSLVWMIKDFSKKPKTAMKNTAKVRPLPANKVGKREAKAGKSSKKNLK